MKQTTPCAEYTLPTGDTIQVLHEEFETEDGKGMSYTVLFVNRISKTATIITETHLGEVLVDAVFAKDDATDLSGAGGRSLADAFTLMLACGHKA